MTSSPKGRKGTGELAKIMGKEGMIQTSSAINTKKTLLGKVTKEKNRSTAYLS